MSRNVEDPKEEVCKDGSLHDYSITHPAYGIVRVTHPTGGEMKLFGSDMKHNNRICLTFYKAVEDRSLSNSWLHEKEVLMEVELSETQWASLVSSNMGSPTPITYRHYRDGNLVNVPLIGQQKTEREKFSKEYQDTIKTHMERGQAALTKLMELKEKGKAGKKDIDDLISIMQQSLGRFVSDTTFSAKCFEEVMEKTVTHAQVEIENSISNLAKRIGAEHLGISLDKNLLSNIKEVDNDH